MHIYIFIYLFIYTIQYIIHMIRKRYRQKLDIPIVVGNNNYCCEIPVPHLVHKLNNLPLPVSYLSQKRLPTAIVD